jgi:hypothetical protein
LSFGYTRSIDNGATLSKGMDSDQGTSVSHGYGIARAFEHYEAMTKMIVGLKMITDRGSRYADDLRNLVVIFYTKEGCFDELAIRRLGWAQDGTYEPPQLGCRHYTRSIRVFAPCCQRWVDCEHCHNEQAKDGHKMDPYVALL